MRRGQEGGDTTARPISAHIGRSIKRPKLSEMRGAAFSPADHLIIASGAYACQRRAWSPRAIFRRRYSIDFTSFHRLSF